MHANQSSRSMTIKAISGFFTTLKDMNPHLISAQYAVRGRVPTEAQKIQSNLKKGVKYPFDSIIELNIGNPQSFGQPPISFNREVTAALVYPELLNTNAISKDAKTRARQYQENIGCSIGAYTASHGLSLVREQIANYIQRRDGTRSRPSIDQIMLTDGASQGINISLQALLQGPKDGVMIPIPQYPLYSASIEMNRAQSIPYYLDEDQGWQITVQELNNQYDKAVKSGIKPKIIVVINPGNPTGQVLDRESIENIIKFATDKKIVVFADEVYQTNIYSPKKAFHSFRKVKESLPAPYNTECELFSFHSISKGISGECGFRGGYMEMSSLREDVMFEINKAKTIVLCSNTVGQVLTGLLVTPPTKAEGFSDETVERFNKECDDLFKSLVRRSKIVTDALHSIKGISAQEIEGAMYAFPQLELSNKFIQHAQSQGFQNPDEFYCLEALNNTGLVLVPGSGFFQKEGTHHFRTTTLIYPEERLRNKLHDLKVWHERYMQAF